MVILVLFIAIADVGLIKNRACQLKRGSILLSTLIQQGAKAAIQAGIIFVLESLGGLLRSRSKIILAIEKESCNIVRLLRATKGSSDRAL